MRCTRTLAPPTLDRRSHLVVGGVGMLAAMPFGHHRCAELGELTGHLEPRRLALPAHGISLLGTARPDALCSAC